MRKFSDFLTKYGVNIINSFVLIIMFVLTIFISTTININQTKALISNTFNNQQIIIKSSNQNNGEYKDFLIHYYETQADLVNKWLAVLGILAALGGIGIPLLLSTSYKEKIKEMQCEVDKNINIVSVQKEKLKETIENIKKDYNEKMTKFRREMEIAIEKAETDNILTKLESLEEEAERFKDKGQEKEEIDNINQIIKLGEKSINKYKKSENFIWNVARELEKAYFSRGLSNKGKNNKLAIKDFEQCCRYNKILKYGNSPTLQQCLLECYIHEKQFDKAIELTKTITQINKEIIDGTHSVYKRDLFSILKEANDPKATELYNLLDQIAVE